MLNFTRTAASDTRTRSSRNDARANVAQRPANATSRPSLSNGSTQAAPLRDRATLSREATSREAEGASRVNFFAWGDAPNAAPAASASASASAAAGASAPASPARAAASQAFTQEQATEIAINSLRQARTAVGLPNLGTLAEEASRRASGVPEALENHSYGPPAPPSSRETMLSELDENGNPRLGTLVNETENGGHRYVRRGELPAGTTREEAEEAFRTHRAPTTEALYGGGDSPTSTEGSVDIRGPLGDLAHALPWQAQLLVSAAQAISPVGGGDVTMSQGRTPDGMPWAVNSTVDGRHPLAGHITRTLEERNGRFYIRTEGVGSGDDSWAGMRHELNSWLGPVTFANLDEATARDIERLRQERQSR